MRVCRHLSWSMQNRSWFVHGLRRRSLRPPRFFVFSARRRAFLACIGGVSSGAERTTPMPSSRRRPNPIAARSAARRCVNGLHWASGLRGGAGAPAVRKATRGCAKLCGEVCARAPRRSADRPTDARPLRPGNARAPKVGRPSRPRYQRDSNKWRLGQNARKHASRPKLAGVTRAGGRRASPGRAAQSSRATPRRPRAAWWAWRTPGRRARRTPRRGRSGPTAPAPS